MFWILFGIFVFLVLLKYAKNYFAEEQIQPEVKKGWSFSQFGVNHPEFGKNSTKFIRR